MGEAKRREELGLPPREKKVAKKDSKSNLNQILNKYPFAPYIFGNFSPYDFNNRSS